jgi:microcystin-dependent protein
MAEPFLGEIRIFGFDYAPVGWAMCNGQLVPITQNVALFDLIGTYYGGNGTSNFALPDYRSRHDLHMGGTFVIGGSGGQETATLTEAQLPVHAHVPQSVSGATTTNPAGAYWAPSGDDEPYGELPGGGPTTTAGPCTMGTGLSPTGGDQPFSTIPPYLTLNFCIALQGLFPSHS